MKKIERSAAQVFVIQKSQYRWKIMEHDFEEAPAAALRNVYGDQLPVSGCWIHYAQALIKRLRKLGMTGAYRNDADTAHTQTIFQCLLSLRLLPVADIAPGFQEVKASLPAQSATSASIRRSCFVTLSGSASTSQPSGPPGCLCCA